MDYASVKIERIRLNRSKAVFTISINEHVKYEQLSFKLNDFDEIWDGRIIIPENSLGEYIDSTITVDFTLSKRFKEFKDGILKTSIRINNKDIVCYNVIYALNYTEVYDGSIEKIEEYFDEVEEAYEQIEFNNIDEKEVDEFEYEDEDLIDSDETVDFSLFDYIDDDLIHNDEEDLIDFSIFDDEEDLEGDVESDNTDEREEMQKLVQTNGYDASWIDFEITPWKVEYNVYQGNKTLSVNFEIKYFGKVGNILNDFKVYITNLKSERITTSIYLSNTMPTPSEIDIWYDNKDHIIELAPSFLVKEIGDIADGIKFTISFIDSLKKYRVRKTYTLIDDIWWHEELIAIPLYLNSIYTICLLRNTSKNTMYMVKL